MEQGEFETPVLFLIFNRPDLTKQVFEQIRKVKPKQLFIAADGPRASNPEDTQKCAKAREIVLDMIDWECEVKTLFRDENLGCGLAVSSAITWFFEHVEMGIILEDDCYPDLSFFSFCEQLLIHYKDHGNVMHIGGTNWQLDRKRGDGSYYFSNIAHVWGWATWKRAWSKYDHAMAKLTEDSIPNESILSNAYGARFRKHFIKEFNNAKKEIIDSWAYRWQYSIWKNGGFSAIPNFNLVKNIGFTCNATHTKGEPRNYNSIKLEKIAAITYSDNFNLNNSADTFYFDNFIRNRSNIFKETLKIVKKIKRVIWHFAPKDYFNALRIRKQHKGDECNWEVIEEGPAKGFELLIAKDEFTGWEEMLNGNYDSFLFEEIRSNGELKGKVIWDIGAHFGYHSLAFSKMVGENGRVIAFEPNKFNYDRLNKNILHNDLKNVSAFDFAISDSTGSIKMMISDNVDGSQSTGSYLINAEKPLDDQIYKAFYFEQCVVEQNTIDNLAEDLAAPNIIKIDVEGAEYLVLKGAKRLLKSSSPILLMEIHNVTLMHEVCSFLMDIGYRSRIIGEELSSLSRCFIYAEKK